MAGPVIRDIREDPGRAWLKPENASVFDPAWRGPIRSMVHALGLDDPQSIMGIAAPMEMPGMAGGPTIAASLKSRFPRFAAALDEAAKTVGKAIDLYRHPAAEGGLSAPFYSRLDEAVAGLPKQTFGPRIAGVAQKGLASSAELEARGVPEFLASAGSKPIDRAALEAHLADHPVPQGGVVRRGGEFNIDAEIDTLRKHGYDISSDGELEDVPYLVSHETGNPIEHDSSYYFTDNPSKRVPLRVREAYERILSEDIETQTKFSQYQLPGGENYRETLLTLPDAEFSKPETRFRSSHFEQPNILVHTRSNEREIPGLGRGTFLEEVQSDWHQAGKERGYRQQELPAVTVKHVEGDRFPWKAYDPDGTLLYEGMLGEDDIRRSARGVLEQRMGDRPPNAPFKDTWPDLALKHHLIESAQRPDVNWLGFTSGETQAARYDLSQHIGHVTARPAHDGLIHLEALTPDMGSVVINDLYPADKLDDVIGKELSDKIRSGVRFPTGPGDMGTPVELSGLDLKTGGEGMHEFYDKLLPKRLEKIVKPFGGTVERAPIKDGSPAWVVRLTPAMKRRILTEGLPFLGVTAAVKQAQEPAEGGQ